MGDTHICTKLLIAWLAIDLIPAISVTAIREEPALLTVHLTSTLVGWNEVAHAYSFHWGETTLQNLSGPRKRSYELPYPGSGGGFFNLLQPLQQIWKNLGEIHHKSTNKGHPYKINIGKEKLRFISTQKYVSGMNQTCRY